ncbi:MAG TPA: hypothetical protein PLO52_00415 [Flavobacterium alvei]|nr:hypothetical protein [Flavobacterium alvei]
MNENIECIGCQRLIDKNKKSNDLIAEQQIEIRDLKNILKEHRECFQDISNMMFCIGGPLNDNIAQFTKEQRRYFHEIKNNCEAVNWGRYDQKEEE